MELGLGLEIEAEGLVYGKTVALDEAERLGDELSLLLEFVGRGLGL